MYCNDRKIDQQRKRLKDRKCCRCTINILNAFGIISAYISDYYTMHTAAVKSPIRKCKKVVPYVEPDCYAVNLSHLDMQKKRDYAAIGHFMVFNLKKYL